MKKRMIAGMMLLVLTISGCSAVSTAPTTINELAEETRAETETESTDSILPSESEKADAPVESKAPEETASPESAAAPEETASQPIAEEAPKAPDPAVAVSSESKQPAAETTPAPTEQPQTVQQELQATQQPTTETPPPAPPQPTAAPEEAKPKTAYDPVMQTPNEPNFYLKHNFEKEYSDLGTPYVQEDCDIAASDNLVIYGHHIKGQKMFGALESYKDRNFYGEHKVIQFDTLTQHGEYEII